MRSLGALNGVSFKGEETFGMKRARKDNRNSTIIRLWIFGLGSVRSEWCSGEDI
jgi:hypothetical protein